MKLADGVPTTVQRNSRLLPYSSRQQPGATTILLTSPNRDFAHPTFGGILGYLGMVDFSPATFAKVCHPVGRDCQRLTATSTLVPFTLKVKQAKSPLDFTESPMNHFSTE
jgi:hypothetical protein